jgi:hypothetical protein
MDRIAELVQLLEPEVAAPSSHLQARQREDLFRFMASVEKADSGPAHWRLRAWHLAIAGSVAAVAVAAATFVPGSSTPRSPLAAPRTSAVLTAVTRALTSTGGDIEEIQSSISAAIRLSSTSWIDLDTGICRTDTSINAQPSLTVFVGDGNAVIIDYARREWWTREASGVTCESPLTPQAIEHDVTTGDYRLAGHATVGGQPALKLVSTTTGAQRVTKVTTLWVNATTYLPIQSTSLGHAREQTLFTWLPATSVNAAILDFKVPAGFLQVVTAPSPDSSGP